MSTIITRVGFCSMCSNLRNPRTGQNFLAYGSTNHCYHVLEAQRNGMIGFVPHNYRLEKRLGDNIVVFKSCAMYGCGVDRRYDNSDSWIYFIKEWRREIWDIQQWNALIVLKHNQFTLNYEV